MTLACTMGMDMVIAHVGDSRAYLFRNGKLDPLTRDQTMAQFLADTGMIDPDEISKHPLRNALTSAMGTQGGPMDVDLHGMRLADGDQVLLCTDGLTEMISESAIAEVLGHSTTPAADVCQQLVDLALDGGGRDNITVVLGRYRVLPGLA
jgi:protein phosphatase